MIPTELDYCLISAGRKEELASLSLYDVDFVDGQ